MEHMLAKLRNFMLAPNRYERISVLSEIKLNQLLIPRRLPLSEVKTFETFRSHIAATQPELATLLEPDGEAAQAVATVVDGLRRTLAERENPPHPFLYNADRTVAMLCYALARQLKPKIVLETGVCYGVSTALFLLAMERNNAGRLISIDLPPLLDTAASFVGAAVPQELRHRWTLHLGGSRRLLPQVLNEVGEVDLFFADDATVLSLQKHEFSTAWPRVKSGGVVIVDDIGKQFWNFLRTVPTGPVHLIRQVEKPTCATALIHKN